MNDPNAPVAERKSLFLLAFFGLIAPFLTFAIALASVPASTKILVLALVAAAYTFLFVAAFARMRASKKHATESLAFEPISEVRTDRELSASITDTVTGLPNAQAMMLVLQHQLGESNRDRDDRPISVIAIDIEGFADRTGNSDVVLKFAAETLSRHLRSMDFLARVDGDEFVLVLPKTDRPACGDVIERINHSFASTSFANGDENASIVTLNFGVASFWEDGETPEQLVHHAQLEKQRAKAERPVAAVSVPDEYVN
jgi:diguanylate cyclase (GGDEF)-like protein